MIITDTWRIERFNNNGLNFYIYVIVAKDWTWKNKKLELKNVFLEAIDGK